MPNTPSVFTSRPAIFLYAILLHVVVFALVAHLRIGSTPVPVTDDVPPFQMVKLPPPAAPPPPPPPPLNVLPSLAGGGAPTPALAPIVITTPQAHFTVPMPDISGPGTALAMLHALHGTGSGGTTTAGAGQGNTTDDSGNGIADICGLKISTSETVVVFEDVFEENHARLSDGNREKIRRYAEECIAKFFFGVTPIQVDGDLIFYDPQNPKVHSQGDFFKAAYPMEDAGPDGKAPTVMLFIGEWQGQTDATIGAEHAKEDMAQASEHFIASLRAHHIKLYLLSTHFQPYQALIDYAKESGGQVSIKPRPPLQDLK